MRFSSSTSRSFWGFQRGGLRTRVALILPLIGVRVALDYGAPNPLHLKAVNPIALDKTCVKKYALLKTSPADCELGDKGVWCFAAAVAVTGGLVCRAPYKFKFFEPKSQLDLHPTLAKIQPLADRQYLFLPHPNAPNATLYNIPRACSIFDHLCERPGNPVLSVPLYNAFLEAYVNMAGSKGL
ncbi:hypothetical protein DXG01_003843 [Tephrocybe rancida]|nr:hypothetical protein DXG01_003843 [Tephrocybe rancida]